MKSKFALTLLTLFISTSVLAIPQKPEKCPSAEAIKSTKFTTHRQSKIGYWIALQYDYQYDTNNHWKFVMTDVPGANVQEARDNASTMLATLFLTNGPVYYDALNVYGCDYSNFSGHYAYAATPPHA